MTFKELYQLQTLKKEITEQERRLKQLRAASTALSGSSDGLPKTERVSDRVGAIVAEIATLEASINNELAEYWREYVELEMYIANIQDSLTSPLVKCK